MKSQFNDSLKFILTEMCRVVGVNYDDIDFETDDWYRKCDWTLQESQMFEKWLSDYLYNNAKARREIMKNPYKNKKHCDDVSHWFMFQYGWKYCD